MHSCEAEVPEDATLNNLQNACLSITPEYDSDIDIKVVTSSLPETCLQLQNHEAFSSETPEDMNLPVSESYVDMNDFVSLKWMLNSDCYLFDGKIHHGY